MWVRYLVPTKHLSGHNEVFGFFMLLCTIDRTPWTAACFIPLIYSRYGSILLSGVQIVSPSLSVLVCKSCKLILRIQIRHSVNITLEFFRVLAQERQGCCKFIVYSITLRTLTIPVKIPKLLSNDLVSRTFWLKIFRAPSCKDLVWLWIENEFGSLNLIDLLVLLAVHLRGQI